MFYLERVQRGIDFIEAHLAVDIELAEVAHAAGLSQWHFQRIFKALSNETLKSYIRSRRFAQVLGQLRTTALPLYDIGLAAGYTTQESFTRAFKVCFKLTPGQYRRVGSPLPFVKKIEINQDYLRQLHRNITLTPEIKARAALKLVGMRTDFYGVDSEKNNLGQKLPPLWASFMPRLGEIKHRVPGVCYGVIEQIGHARGQLRYHAAIEVSEFEPLAPGMHGLEIPPSTYARFCHRGLPSALDNTVNYIYSSWLLPSQRQHSCGADLEIYGADYVPDSADSVMHYAIPLLESPR